MTKYAKTARETRKRTITTAQTAIPTNRSLFRLSVPGLGRQVALSSCRGSDCLRRRRAVGALGRMGVVRASARAYLGPRPHRAVGR